MHMRATFGRFVGEYTCRLHGALVIQTTPRYNSMYIMSKIKQMKDKTKRFGNRSLITPQNNRVPACSLNGAYIYTQLLLDRCFKALFKRNKQGALPSRSSAQPPVTEGGAVSGDIQHNPCARMSLAMDRPVHNNATEHTNKYQACSTCNTVYTKHIFT